jgi:hypothetical protein
MINAAADSLIQHLNIHYADTQASEQHPMELFCVLK